MTCKYLEAEIQYLKNKPNRFFTMIYYSICDCSNLVELSAVGADDQQVVPDLPVVVVALDGLLVSVL
jgi:hypothetical protein